MSRFSIVEPQSTAAAGKVNVHNWQHTSLTLQLPSSEKSMPAMPTIGRD